MGLPVGRRSLIGEGGDHLKFGMGVGGDVTQRTACAWVAYARVWES